MHVLGIAMQQTMYLTYILSFLTNYGKHDHVWNNFAYQAHCLSHLNTFMILKKN